MLLYALELANILRIRSISPSLNSLHIGRDSTSQKCFSKKSNRSNIDFRIYKGVGKKNTEQVQSSKCPQVCSIVVGCARSCAAIVKQPGSADIET